MTNWLPGFGEILTWAPLLTYRVGIFVANADGSILLATHATIASDFNDLGNSTWLITSFALAGAATQTLVCGVVEAMLSTLELRSVPS